MGDGVLKFKKKKRIKEGRFQLWRVPVVGIFFEGRQKYLANLSPNEAVELEREPENPYDKNAVKVIIKGHHVGYVPRALASYLALFPNYSLHGKVAEIYDQAGACGLKINIFADKDKN